MKVLRKIWRSLFAESPYAAPAREAYLTVVAQARQTVFYESLGVPDTVDGRFEMIALHAILLVHRVKGRGPASDQFGREFMSYLFADMDRNLREMGTGDMRVGKRIKEMADAFYGRAKAYQAAIDSAAPMLEEALARNVYVGNPEHIDGLGRLTDIVRSQLVNLDGQDLAEILAGRVRFEAPSAA
ncbi:MAG: ubiquinol-cytochrome C chaperone [Alphaproteobacteria bacterium]|nr:ubiquinol-cytochrome C chaperone [Alphaproteobacteria bacterium]